MKRFGPTAAMLLFGFATIGGLAVYLMLYQGSPGPLAAPHAKAIPGSSVRSCKQCHAEQGLAAGCLACHEEIAGQLEGDTGLHAYLLRGKTVMCESCHPDHNGAAFPLVGTLAWKGLDRENFSHPHVAFLLTGHHEGLACEKCHPCQDPTTFLGQDQQCSSCHEDIHKSGEASQTCSECHDQNQFKPAAFFDHDRYFQLEGRHATAACAACHPLGLTGFGSVEGKGCADCHKSPHRFEFVPPSDCQSCHQASDENWNLGRRGIDPHRHAAFGFTLDAPHANLACDSCHAASLPYVERFPNPGRTPDQCRSCHADPHAGQFAQNHPDCLNCHRRDGFVPSLIDPDRHAKSYPLTGAHRAVACSQCHPSDAENVRRFTDTPTDCKACHISPHAGQFRETLREGDCTACHRPDAETFRISDYRHSTQAAFFQGKGHRQATCSKCHVPAKEGGAVFYPSAPTACASCHTDVHRGQFRPAGCEICHDSVQAWSAGNFDHDGGTRFPLEGAHANLACAVCHVPVPQPDGKPVVQYRPLTTRCEDCHGFISK